MNLYDVFLERANQQPEQPLIITATESHSYGVFARQTQQFAARLKQHGINAGQCVGLHFPNSPNYIRLTYAIWGCGACVVPIPVELGAAEKAQIFHNISMDVVISSADLMQDLAEIQNADPVKLADDVVLIETKPFCTHPHGFADVNAAFLRFSSGTTGTAKGVVLSHETIFRRIHAANDWLQLSSEDRVVWMLSMAYHFAVSIVAYLSFGATILICPNTFGRTIIQTARKHNATLIYAAPVHYMLMTHDRSAKMMPSVRTAIVTTTALSAEVGEAFYRRFQLPLNETYGIIEVGLPCINLHAPWEKRGSVGKVLPSYELKIDQESHENGVGDILLRGAGFVDAYYRPWRPREEILAQNDGWFATGDIGEMDADGFLFIRGRSKEVISVGGMKFFPQEVETVLEQHPDVQEAVVFRYPDKRLGDVPYAQVVVDEDAVPNSVSSLQDFCKAHLAAHKVPEQIMFVQSLQRTASGKRIRNHNKLMDDLQ